MIRGLYLNGMTDDWSACLDIRKDVYLEEYGREIDVDESDEMAIQVILYDKDEMPVGTVRLHFDLDGYFKFDYLAVKKSERGKGYADFMMHMIFDKAKLCGASHLDCYEDGHYRSYFDKYGFIDNGDHISLDLNNYFNTHKCCH